MYKLMTLARHGASVDARGQPTGVCSLLPPCGLQELNSGIETWQQAPLPVEFLFSCF